MFLTPVQINVTLKKAVITLPSSFPTLDSGKILFLVLLITKNITEKRQKKEYKRKPSK